MKDYVKNLIIGLVIVIIVIALFLIFKHEKEIDESLTHSLPVSVENIEVNDKYNNLEDLKKDITSSNKLIAYLSQNYYLKDDSVLVARDLEVIVKSDKLNLADFTYFTSYLLQSMNIESGVIEYEYGDKVNLVVVFREEDIPKYITFTDKGVLMFEHGWSFEDLIKAEENRLNISIDRYAYFPAETIDFSQIVNPYDWQYLN
jgi:predicted ribonuclease YlaK